MKKHLLFVFVIVIIIVQLISPYRLISAQLVWSTYLGGSNTDELRDLKIDLKNNIYVVTGYTSSSNFPTTTGAYDTSYSGNGDAIVTRFKPDGISLVFSTFIGEASCGYAINIDTSGHIYITGSVSSANFPTYSTTPPAYDDTYNGGVDIFVTKIAPDGASLLYSTFLGSNTEQEAYGIVVDKQNNAIICGYSHNGYPITTGSPYSGDTITDGYGDVIISKLNSTGSTLISSRYLGGSNADFAMSICLDNTSNIYLCGTTMSYNFPVTLGAYQEINKASNPNGKMSGFITKLNPTAEQILYSSFLGGTIADDCDALAVDSSSNIYIGTEAGSNDFPTTSNAYSRINNGNDIAFTKMNNTGSLLIYSSFYGGSGYETPYRFFLDDEEKVYITGTTTSDDFPLVNNLFNYGGGQDCFIIKIDPDQSGINSLAFSSYLGGTNYEMGFGISAPYGDDIFITGITYSSNFPVTPGSFDTTYNGYDDGFIAKIKICDGNPVIQATNSHIFNLNYCDTSRIDTIIIHNTGTCKLLLYDKTITGLNPGNFSIVGNNTFPIIKSGDSIPVVVKFHSDSTGIKTALLNIKNNTTGGTWTISLTGRKDILTTKINDTDSDTIDIDLGIICPGGVLDTTIMIINTSTIGTMFTIDELLAPFMIENLGKVMKKEEEAGQISK